MFGSLLSPAMCNWHCLNSYLKSPNVPIEVVHLTDFYVSTLSLPIFLPIAKYSSLLLYSKKINAFSLAAEVLQMSTNPLQASSLMF